MARFRFISLTMAAALLGPAPAPTARAQCVKNWFPDSNQLTIGKPNGVWLEYNSRFYCGLQAAPYIASWDGTSWKPVGFGLNGAPTAMTVYQGSLVVAGNFTTAGSASGVGHIAKWNGGSWSAVAGGLNSGIPNALAVYGGDLVAAGGFTGQLARWNPITTPAWTTIPSAFNGTPTDLAVYGGNLVVAGTFTKEGTTTVDHLAQTTGPGGWVWTTVGTNIVNSTGTVNDLEVYNNEFYVAAGFISLNFPTSTHQGLARWNGSAWNHCNLTSPQVVNDICVYNNLLAAGGNNNPGNFLTLDAWNGSSWVGIGGLGGDTPFVQRVGSYQGNLLAMGSFAFDSYSDSPSIDDLAMYDGTKWRHMTAGIDTGFTVFAAIDHGGSAVIAQKFDDSESCGCGTYELSLAVWDDLEHRWRTFADWGALNSDVFAMASYGSDLIVGGRKLAVPNTPPLGGYNTVTGQWNSAYALNDSGASINALCTYGFGFVAGGQNFSNAGSASVSNIAFWNGTAWTALGAGLDGPVTSVAASGIDLYASGGFAFSGTTALNRVARWNGSAWSALGAGLDAPGKLIIYQGQLIVGGAFVNAGGAGIKNIARWDAVSSSWKPLAATTALDLNGSVTALTVSGNQLVVSGAFTAAGGASANHAAIWNGTSWAAAGHGFSPGANILVPHNGDVFAIDAGFPTLNYWKDGKTFDWLRFTCRPCKADFNLDGFVTGDDFDAFVNAFIAGDEIADFDEDGFVTGDDFDAFVAAFDLGC